MELGYCEELFKFVPSDGEVAFAIMGRHKKGQIYECPFHVIQFSLPHRIKLFFQVTASEGPWIHSASSRRSYIDKRRMFLNLYLSIYLS